MSCRQEDHDHNSHDHHHGGDDGHDHVPPPDTNASQSLYQRISHDGIRTLNEHQEGAGRDIFKDWEHRLDTTKLLKSDEDIDEQLLIFVPFTGLVRLHSLLIRSASDEQAPKTIKLFKNREDVDFSIAEELVPVVKFHHPVGVGGSETEELSNDTSDEDAGIVEYALNRAQFSNVTNLTIFIQDNHGADVTELFYIGLRGEWTKLNKAPVVALYEAAANPRDHKNLVPGDNLVPE